MPAPPEIGQFPGDITGFIDAVERYATDRLSDLHVDHPDETARQNPDGTKTLAFEAITADRLTQQCRNWRYAPDEDARQLSVYRIAEVLEQVRVRREKFTTSPGPARKTICSVFQPGMSSGELFDAFLEQRGVPDHVTARCSVDEKNRFEFYDLNDKTRAISDSRLRSLCSEIAR